MTVTHQAPPQAALTILEIVNRASDIETFFEREMADKGERFSVAQARILLLASDYPGLTPSRLAVELHQMTHSISGLLNRLEDRGFVDRSHDRVDRRVVHVSLTRDGARWLAVIREVLAKAEAKFGQIVGARP